MFEKSLHGLRGIAAFGVFVAHCAGGYAQNLCDQCTYRPVLDILNNLGTFGVEIFFFLSGFVIYLSSLKADPMPFFKRRFWRLYPVFFLFTALFAFANYFANLEPEKNQLDFLFYNLTFTNLLAGTPALTPNAWTISFEVTFYLFTFTAVFFGLRRKNIGVFLLVMIGAILFLIEHPISFYYIAGVALAALDRHYTAWRYTINTCVVRMAETVSIATILMLSGIDHIFEWSWLSGPPTMLLLVFSVFIYIGSLLHPASLTRKFLELKPLMYLGTISYSLYLAHPYSYLVSRKITELTGHKVGFSQEIQLLVFTFLALGTTLGLSILVHRLVEVPCYQRMTGKKIVGTS